MLDRRYRILAIAKCDLPAKASVCADRRENGIGPTPSKVTDEAMGSPQIRFNGRAMTLWRMRSGKRRLPILEYTFYQPPRRVCSCADLFIINRSIE